MKQYSFNLSQVINDRVFPHHRVKTKAKIIEILMEATRFILLQNDTDFIIDDNDAVSKMILHLDKMKRLFFFAENKYYSIVFPFNFLHEDDKYKIRFKSNIEVTSQLISKVISIIQCDEFKANCSLEFSQPICDYQEECDENFWEFLRELLLMEDGYIRYDVDPIRYCEAQAKGEEDIHPLNHYDLFYSNSATFKIGLKDRLTNSEFIDLLNVKTDCKFVE